MPTSNDQVLLQTLLDQTRSEVAPELAASEYFQLYVLEQLLKDRGLSYAELQSGIVDGGGDGGIDALYTLVNGVLVTSTDDAIVAGPGSMIELIIVQSKYTGGFSEAAIDRLIASIGDLLDLSTPLDSLGEVYNADLLNAVEAFRNAYIGTASRFPSLKVHFFYATRGIVVDPKVERKARRLKDLVSSLFSAAECNFTFLTAAHILALARRQQPATLELKLAENPISTKGAGFVSLVKLEDYFDFLTDSQGRLLRVLFESNVRDYEGSRGINQAIQETLVSANDERDDDFWWLNNGITVVASRATLVSKRLTIENPQIVNGLQTSVVIFNYFDQNKLFEDGRTVLVRVIVPSSEASRDRIIRATNSQIAIPGVALRATDKIQRDIEEYFLSHGYYYERRKNKYQNLGRPLSRIFTIPYVAEAILAVVLHEPHFGNPRVGGRFLRDDELYKRIFNNEVPLAAYLQSALLVRLVQETRKDLTDTRRKAKTLSLFVASVISAMKVGRLHLSPDAVAAHDFTTMTPQEVETAVRATADRMDWNVPGKALRLPPLSLVLADLGIVDASSDMSSGGSG